MTGATWVLIFWITASGPYGSTNVTAGSALFKTELACRAASDQMTKRLRDNFGGVCASVWSS